MQAGESFVADIHNTVCAGDAFMERHMFEIPGRSGYWLAGDSTLSTICQLTWLAWRGNCMHIGAEQRNASSIVVHDIATVNSFHCQLATRNCSQSSRNHIVHRSLRNTEHSFMCYCSDCSLITRLRFIYNFFPMPKHLGQL